MRGRTILALVLVAGGVVGAFTFSPALRARAGRAVQAVREDFGPGEPPTTMGGEVRVYMPRSDGYYHRRDCPRLGGRPTVPTPLSEAELLRPPCPECRPPR